jgi:hypothetical protein
LGRFGEYLIAQGALTEQRLAEALEAQRVHGGRLGTNLIEQGYLVLEDLATLLSGFHEAPLPPTAWLERPDRRALQLVPRALIRRFHVLPLRLERDRIHVALIDPGDSHLRELIEAAAAREVAAYLLPELRLLYWLEIHCGIDRHPRFVNLATRVRLADEEALPPPRLDDTATDSALSLQPLAAGEELTNELVLAHGSWSSTPVEVPEDAEPFAFGRDASDDSELLLEEIAELPARTPAASRIAAPSGPGEVAMLEAMLQGAEERDGVVELALRLSLAFARHAALFVVRGDSVAAHRCAGPDIRTEPSEIVVPLAAPSLFSRPAINGLPFRGQPPHDGTDGRILEALGRCGTQEVLIQPVSIRGRVVNLLYADNGGDALGDTQVAALDALARTVSAAYERLILEAKRAR